MSDVLMPTQVPFIIPKRTPHTMILTTTPTIEGYKIKNYLGIVTSESIIGDTKKNTRRDTVGAKSGGR